VGAIEPHAASVSDQQKQYERGQQRRRAPETGYRRKRRRDESDNGQQDELSRMRHRL
jgi:hypothetical protein